MQPPAKTPRCLSVAACVILALSIQPISGPLQTDEKLHSSNAWRPTQGAAATGFAGSAACSPCHARLVATHQVTGMAKALRSAENCQVLASHPSLTFRNNEYTYQIDRQSGRSLYKVSYRDESISVRGMVPAGALRLQLLDVHQSAAIFLSALDRGPADPA